MSRRRVDVDPYAPDFAERGWRLYEELRASSAVAYSETYGGFWLVSRYACLWARCGA